jgi:hypothetical protein
MDMVTQLTHMGIMVTTTLAKVPKIDRRLPQVRWAEASAALIILVVIAISLPSFFIDVSLVDAHFIRWKSEQGERIDPVDLRRASIEYEAAARLYGSEPLNWKRSATTAISAAQLSGQGGELAIARNFLVRAAMRSPSHGSVWTHLIYLDHLAGTFDDQTADAWRLASLTSRLELDEMKVRLWIGLLMWPQLPEDIRADLVSLGHVLWSPRVNWPARKAMAEVYARLPLTARSRVFHLLPSPEDDLIALARLASKTVSD